MIERPPACQSLKLRRVRTLLACIAWIDVAFSIPYQNLIGTRKDIDFGAPWPACLDLHTERLRQRHLRPFEECRSRWLIVLHKTLSLSIPTQFIPALLGFVFGIEGGIGRL